MMAKNNKKLSKLAEHANFKGNIKVCNESTPYTQICDLIRSKYVYREVL